jgi:subtilisin family serine protease
VLVKYKTLVKTSVVRSVEQKLRLTFLSHNVAIKVYRYKVASHRDVFEVVAELSSDPAVEFAEPNYYHYLNITPNDPFYANFRTSDGRTFPSSLQRWVYHGVDTHRNVNGEAAWDLTTGRNDVVIAIVDTGIDLDHPDLAPNIWRNPGEVPDNGIDDDGNSFIDDVHGWDFRGNTHGDFSEPDNDPNPDLGDGLDNDRNGTADDATFHGTFVAGIAGARGNDSVGIAGACWHCQLMALKVFTDDGGANSMDIADAIIYAANNGADVINLSFGGCRASLTLRNAINFAHAHGVVVVAAAGNDNSAELNFPASFDHVISVGASDWGGDYPIGITPDMDGRAEFSQFGPDAVDVVAPGVVASTSVLSVADERKGKGRAGDPTFDISGGTSFSAPLVAGLAALVISRAKNLNLSITNDQVESIIQNTAVDLPDDPDDSPDGGPNWDSRGCVDMLAALNTVGY